MFEPDMESRTPEAGDPFPEALGQSEAFLDFQERLSRVAGIERPVLIMGERGTGKELAARRLHYLSKRWEEVFVELNCAALTPTLIESELFGHEAGALTGASMRRHGRFESANGGTLFLDELGNVPRQVQEKILRVVEYGAFERVGGAEMVQADVRIVGATNADLSAMADAGEFMRDLLDRLSFEVLYLPPLRERREDILVLANHFAARMAYELGRDEIPEFTPTAIAELEAHPWRGNVRELKNVIERAVYRADSLTIDDLDFDPFRSPYAPIPRPVASAPPAAPEAQSAPTAPTIDTLSALPFKEAVVEFETALVQRALRDARHNQRKAAQRLGLTYDQFRGLYRKYGEARMRRGRAATVLY